MFLLFSRRILSKKEGNQCKRNAIPHELLRPLCSSIFKSVHDNYSFIDQFLLVL